MRVRSILRGQSPNVAVDCRVDGTAQMGAVNGENGQVVDFGERRNVRLAVDLPGLTEP